MTIDIENNIIYHVDENFNKREHKPISSKFDKIEILDNGNVLIIENYNNFNNKNVSNLYYLNRKIEIEWHIPYPNNDFNDRYVGFSVIGEKIFANTFNGFRVEIDIINFKLKKILFTK